MVPKDHYLDLADGQFKLTTANDLERSFKALEESDRRDSLVVHFHGGLVSRADAEAAAEELMPYYEGGGAFPVFFFWRSDLQTTFAYNLNQIAKEPVFKRLVKRLVQLALAKLIPYVGSRSAGTLPQDDDETMPEALEDLAAYAGRQEPDRTQVQGVALTRQQLSDAETALELDDVIQAESRAIVAHAAPPSPQSGAATRGDGLRDVTPRPTLMSESVVNKLVEEQGGLGARVGVLTFATLALKGGLALKRVIDRFSAGHDHTLYTTIVEELLRELYFDSVGAVTWVLIKKDTLNAFGGTPDIHGGTAFIERLRAWWRPGRRVCLVGHSTGAIYIGHFLQYADVLPPDFKVDVVFLAPACTFAFMAEKLDLFKRRVARFRMFALKDDLERGYWEVPLLYPASLLYMVSGLFEEPTVDMPIVGMQRYFSQAEPYVTPEIAAVIDYMKDHCVWSLAKGGPGLSSSAARHGGFDRDTATRESLKEFLRRGN